MLEKKWKENVYWVLSYFVCRIEMDRFYYLKVIDWYFEC